MKKINTNLTQYEIEAVEWAKRNFKHWRKSHKVTFEEHMSNKPKWISEETWEYLYNSPYGREDFNQYHQTVRKLLFEGRV